MGERVGQLWHGTAESVQARAPRRGFVRWVPCRLQGMGGPAPKLVRPSREWRNAAAARSLSSRVTTLRTSVSSAPARASLMIDFSAPSLFMSIMPPSIYVWVGVCGCVWVWVYRVCGCVGVHTQAHTHTHTHTNIHKHVHIVYLYTHTHYRDLGQRRKATRGDGRGALCAGPRLPRWLSHPHRRCCWTGSRRTRRTLEALTGLVTFVDTFYGPLDALSAADIEDEERALLVSKLQLVKVRLLVTLAVTLAPRVLKADCCSRCCRHLHNLTTSVGPEAGTSG